MGQHTQSEVCLTAGLRLRQHDGKDHILGEGASGGRVCLQGFSGRNAGSIYCEYDK